MWSADVGYNNFNFNSFGNTYSQNEHCASYTPVNSFQSTNNSNFQHIFGDYCVTSSDPSTDDVLSNAASKTPDTPTYNSSEDITSDENTIAFKSTPILWQRLTESTVNQYSNLPTQPQKPQPPSRFNYNQFPQYQLQQQNENQLYSQNWLPNQRYQNDNFRQNNQQKLFQYDLNATNHYMPMLTSHEAMRHQEVGSQMGEVMYSSGSTSKALMPVRTATSPISVHSTGNPTLASPPRKKVSRANKTKSQVGDENEEKLKPHRCPLCPKRFKNKSNVKTHVRIHTREKPFVCPSCFKGFSQKAHLQKHGTVHQKQKY